MHVRVRLFAALRERAGTEAIELELPPRALVRDALAEMSWLTGGLRVVMAVNREYAAEADELHEKDELALIPPVSGGALGTEPARVHARVIDEPVSLDRLLALVKDPRAGAVVTFLGVTREVAALEYEAYREMAQTRMAEIAAEACKHNGLCAAATEHRIGTVELSEASIAIAASAPHRAEAFAGAREIIDRIKAEVPIWKREEGQWLQGNLPAPRNSRNRPPSTRRQGDPR
jgi:molybdopterin synthase catalytic subunit